MYADIVLWFLGIIIVLPMIVIAILSIIVCLMSKKLNGRNEDGENKESNNDTSV